MASSREIGKAARAIRRHQTRQHEYLERDGLYAEVAQADPLILKPHGTSLVLTEDALEPTQRVKQHIKDHGLSTDDTVLVLQMPNDDWVVLDVVTDQLAERTPTQDDIDALQDEIDTIVTGGGDKFASFDVLTPATVWTKTHNFHRYPAGVKAYDNDGNELADFRVEHLDGGGATATHPLDAVSIRLTFSYAVWGRLDLS